MKPQSQVTCFAIFARAGAFVVVPNKMAIIGLDGSCSFVSATRSDRWPAVGNYSSGGLLYPVGDNHGSENFLHGNSSGYCSACVEAIVLVAKPQHELCQNNTPSFGRRAQYSHVPEPLSL